MSRTLRRRISFLTALISVGATLGIALPAPAQATPTAVAGIQTITPTRVLDTRTSNGGHNGTFAAGETYALPILGKGAVPSFGVAAVLANLTVVSSTGSGYLTVFPTGQTRPTASNINFDLNTVVANQFLVPLGANGSISIYSLAAGVHVIVDVSGWVATGSAAAAGATSAMQPVRILDTRTTNGGHNAALTIGETAQIPVLGTHGLPASGISAIWANVTVVPGTGVLGTLTLYASGATPPVETVNVPGVVTANLALIPLAADGSLLVHANDGPMHVVIDVQGLVAAGTPSNNLGVMPVTPFRVLPLSTIGGGTTVSVPILGQGSIPSTGVQAVVAHLVAVAGGSDGYFTAYPSGYQKPTASSLNFKANKFISNSIVIPVGADGSISIYSNAAGPSQVALDVQGWIATPDLTTAGPNALSQVAPTSTDSVDASLALTNATKYAMGTWWSGPAQTLLASTPDATGTVPNDGIRRMGMEALAVSTALATGTYDPTATGVSAATATARVDQLVDRVAMLHVTNSLGGWGESWQSPMWAGIAGRAAWYIWPQLAASTRQHVVNMVEHEAGYGARYKIKYLRNAAGTLLSPGDSGAEEVSWTMSAMQVALVMLPNHQHHDIWAAEVVQFALASFARPADTGSSTVINGAALSTWIKGSNVEANGVIVNHSRVASDYSTTTYQNLDGAALYALAGLAAPRALASLLGPVYGAFTGVTFASPPYAAPGGQTYVSGTGDIYYPEGNDWGVGQRAPYALSDAQALVYGYDPGSAASYLALHLAAQLALQARFSDGRTYLNDAEYNYIGREEHVAQLLSQLYLTLYMRDKALVSWSDVSFWL